MIPSTALMRLHFRDDAVLYLSEKIDDESLETLMKLGPSDRFPNEFATWRKRREEMTQRLQATRTERQEAMHTTFGRNFENELREAVIIEVLKAFP
jgi:hypothetical protein